MATSAASMRPHSICKIDDLDEREEDVASVPGGSVAAAVHSDLSEWYIHTVVTSVSIERGRGVAGVFLHLVNGSERF